MLDAYPDWQIPARVITTVPTADRQKATVLVRIGFREARPAHPAGHGREGHVPARPADATDVTAAQPVTLVPKAAVRTEGNTSFVFVDSRRRRRAPRVQVGGTDGDRLEVRAGLRAGDRVVISPPDSLRDGMRVVVAAS